MGCPQMLHGRPFATSTAIAALAVIAGSRQSTISSTITTTTRE